MSQLATYNTTIRYLDGEILVTRETEQVTQQRIKIRRYPIQEKILYISLDLLNKRVKRELRSNRTQMVDFVRVRNKYLLYRGKLLENGDYRLPAIIEDIQKYMVNNIEVRFHVQGEQIAIILIDYGLQSDNATDFESVLDPLPTINLKGRISFRGRRLSVEPRVDEMRSMDRESINRLMRFSRWENGEFDKGGDRGLLFFKKNKHPVYLAEDEELALLMEQDLVPSYLHKFMQHAKKPYKRVVLVGGEKPAGFYELKPDRIRLDLMRFIHDNHKEQWIGFARILGKLHKKAKFSDYFVEAYHSYMGGLPDSVIDEIDLQDFISSLNSQLEGNELSIEEYKLVELRYVLNNYRHLQMLFAERDISNQLMPRKLWIPAHRKIDAVIDLMALVMGYGEMGEAIDLVVFADSVTSNFVLRDQIREEMQNLLIGTNRLYVLENLDNPFISNMIKIIQFKNRGILKHLSDLDKQVSVLYDYALLQDNIPRVISLDLEHIYLDFERILQEPIRILSGYLAPLEELTVEDDPVQVAEEEELSEEIPSSIQFSWPEYTEPDVKTCSHCAARNMVDAEQCRACEESLLEQDEVTPEPEMDELDDFLFDESFLDVLGINAYERLQGDAIDTELLLSLLENLRDVLMVVDQFKQAKTLLLENIKAKDGTISEMIEYQLLREEEQGYTLQEKGKSLYDDGIREIADKYEAIDLSYYLEHVDDMLEISSQNSLRIQLKTLVCILEMRILAQLQSGKVLDPSMLATAIIFKDRLLDDPLPFINELELMVQTYTQENDAQEEPQVETEFIETLYEPDTEDTFAHEIKLDKRTLLIIRQMGPTAGYANIEERSLKFLDLDKKLHKSLRSMGIKKVKEIRSYAGEFKEIKGIGDQGSKLLNTIRSELQSFSSYNQFDFDLLSHYGKRKLILKNHGIPSPFLDETFVRELSSDEQFDILSHIQQSRSPQELGMRFIDVICVLLGEDKIEGSFERKMVEFTRMQRHYHLLLKEDFSDAEELSVAWASHYQNRFEKGETELLYESIEHIASMLSRIVLPYASKQEWS